MTMGKKNNGKVVQKIAYPSGAPDERAKHDVGRSGMQRIPDSRRRT